MGWWQVNADTLAASRFVVSELAEATASLKALHRATAAHPGEQAWLTRHLPAYRRRLAADPITAVLVRSAFGRAWIAHFLTPTPTGEGERAFDEELARIRQTPPEAARADLTVSVAGSLPDRLHRDDLPHRIADLLEWVWAETVLPDWPWRRRVIEADVVSRTARLTQGGWAAALDGMRPGMRWLGHGRLQVNTHDNPPRDVSGGWLTFVPVTPASGWVSWEDQRAAVVYPCSGALADTGHAPVPQALSTLLGPARARVLMLLGDPMSTTHLVALTGQGLAGVGRPSPEGSARRPPHPATAGGTVGALLPHGRG